MVAQVSTPGTTLTDRQRAWYRALQKAMRLHVAPTALGAGHYDVPASRGGTYRVVRANEHCTAYTCTCPAGEAGEPCYHAASVAGMPYEVAGRNAHRRRLAIAARKAHAA